MLVTVFIQILLQGWAAIQPILTTNKFKITIYTIESDRDAWKYFDFSEIFVDFDLLGKERLDHFSRL